MQGEAQVADDGRPVWRRAAITLSALVLSVLALAVWLVVRDPSPSFAFETYSYVDALDYAPDGKTLASAGNDGKMKVWDTETGALIRTIATDAHGVSSVAFAPDGESIATAGNDPAVKIWDAHSGRLIRTLTGHTAKVNALRFAPDGRLLASGSDDGTIRLWDAAAGTTSKVLGSPDRLLNLPLPGDEVEALAFTPFGDALASGNDGATIKIWDVAAGTVRTTITIPSSSLEIVSSLSFSPDGATLASGGSDGVARLWTTSSGALQQSVPVGGGSFAVAFAPDQNLLVTTGDAIRLWDVASGVATVRRTLPSGWPIALSPDGRRLASGNNGVDWIDIWTIR